MLRSVLALSAMCVSASAAFSQALMVPQAQPPRLVVVAPSQAQQQQPGMPQPTMSPKVTEHLKNGGSALIIFAPQSDNLSDALKEWGIEIGNTKPDFTNPSPLARRSGSAAGPP